LFEKEDDAVRYGGMLEDSNTGKSVSKETYKRDVEIREETYEKEDDAVRYEGMLKVSNTGTFVPKETCKRDP